MLFSPRATFSTSGVSGKLVKTTSTCAATSFGECAATAPSATSSSTAPRERLWTTSGNPALRILRAIDFPINPSPMYPTLSMVTPVLKREFEDYNLTPAAALRLGGG